MTSRRTLLDLIAPEFSSRVAIVLPEERRMLTYAALREQVEEMASALAAAGVERGARVALALPNGHASIVSFLAASQAGTAAPLNPQYTEDEFRFFLDDAQATRLLVPLGSASAARRAASALGIPVIDVRPVGTGSLLTSIAAGRRAATPPRPDDTAVVLHTSGSTARPKRVGLSHENLFLSARNIAKGYALAADDVSLAVMPLFHVHGLVGSTLAAFAAGGTVVIPRLFSPLSFWRLADRYGATWYSGVPTLHQLLLARVEPGRPRPAGAARLRFIRSCSAPLPPSMLRDIEAAFGAPVIEAYGMTEAAHQVASNPLPPGVRRPGSVGHATGVAIAIVDETGRTLGAGEAGEVAIKGPTVISRYEDDRAVNAASFADGWFRTGDQGVLDAAGCLTLVGRLKEMINRGGEKIAPREIDEVLARHRAVTEAVSFGVAHPVWGEEVEAAVVLRHDASEADLLAFCRKHLADFKCPKRIHRTPAIPRTTTGKVQRRLVAQAFSKDTPGRTAAAPAI